MSLLQHVFRDAIFPGLDLHTRNRASLRRFWLRGARDVLDAGSGNGYFSWLAYQSGATVVAINVDESQIIKARGFLNGHRGADPTRLRFEQRNLYDLDQEARSFDEIICFEVLEHIKRDDDVVRQFYRILRPNGLLHLCSPHRLHPRHQVEMLDAAEEGGHVRLGYTLEDYRRLLEPAGFKLEDTVGIGPTSLYAADKLVRFVRNKLGDVFALPLLPLALPFVYMARFNPRVPFSLYVKAKKPA